VINPESAGKERNRMTKAVMLALRELLRQPETSDQTRDLAAFIALALDAIWETIDPSVEAWEKRGYWLKADRFRMEWAWAQKLAKAMRQAVLADDWGNVALTCVQIGEKLGHIKLAERHRLGTPWVGAWKILEGQN
jgi:hypothetical protein